MTRVSYASDPFSPSSRVWIRHPVAPPRISNSQQHLMKSHGLEDGLDTIHIDSSVLGPEPSPIEISGPQPEWQHSRNRLASDSPILNRCKICIDGAGQWLVYTGMITRTGERGAVAGRTPFAADLFGISRTGR